MTTLTSVGNVRSLCALTQVILCFLPHQEKCWSVSAERSTRESSLYSALRSVRTSQHSRTCKFHADDQCTIFTARSSYASAVLMIVILSVSLSVCLSVRLSHAWLWRNKRKCSWYFNERVITLVFLIPTEVGGRCPFHLKFALKVTNTAFKNADLDQYLLITSQL